MAKLIIVLISQVRGSKGKDLIATYPKTIEDVPFRRQDRRILNARKKRLADRKLYKCVMFTGFLITAFGIGLITLFILWKVTDILGEQITRNNAFNISDLFFNIVTFFQF